MKSLLDTLHSDEVQILKKHTFFWDALYHKLISIIWDDYILGYEIVNEPWCGDVYEVFSNFLLYPNFFHFYIFVASKTKLSQN